MMHLKKLRSGHSLKHRVMFRMAPLVLGMQASDIMRALLYRPAFFGKGILQLAHAVMRGESEWSVGERELFAAWVSAKNRCRFCSTAHTAVAGAALGDKLVKAVIDDNDLSGLAPKARAILPFLERLAGSPGMLAPSDLAELRAAGISDEAIVDAVYVCFLFSMFNKFADATGCEPPAAGKLHKLVSLLLGKGYDLIGDTGDDVGVFLGKGDGTFAPGIDYARGWRPYRVATGDFNRDGRLDIATISDGEAPNYGELNILLNRNCR
jgi:uncharacterized peroxidase-related enzyme